MATKGFKSISSEETKTPIPGEGFGDFSGFMKEQKLTNDILLKSYKLFLLQLKNATERLNLLETNLLTLMDLLKEKQLIDMNQFRDRFNQFKLMLAIDDEQKFWSTYGLKQISDRLSQKGDVVLLDLFFIDSQGQTINDLSFSRLITELDTNQYNLTQLNPSISDLLFGKKVGDTIEITDVKGANFPLSPDLISNVARVEVRILEIREKPILN